MSQPPPSSSQHQIDQPILCASKWDAQNEWCVWERKSENERERECKYIYVCIIQNTMDFRWEKDEN